MRTSFDPEADAFYARFASDGTEIDLTQEVAPGVMLDLDAAGNLVGVEVLNVIERGIFRCAVASLPTSQST